MSNYLIKLQSTLHRSWASIQLDLSQKLRQIFQSEWLKTKTGRIVSLSQQGISLLPKPEKFSTKRKNQFNFTIPLIIRIQFSIFQPYRLSFLPFFFFQWLTKYNIGTIQSDQEKLLYVIFIFHEFVLSLYYILTVSRLLILFCLLCVVTVCLVVFYVYNFSKIKKKHLLWWV